MTTQNPIDWTFNGTWPHEPRFLETPEGRIHYIDEGPKDALTVVLLHGNPTWGYLYRNFVPALLDAGCRVVVPDHLGFGRSDKPNVPEAYRIPRHVERFSALAEELELDRVVLVAQDWGGPIGLSWATHHPERVSGLFILNTWAHRARDWFSPPAALKLFRTPVLGGLAVKGLDLFVRGFLFRDGVVQRDRLDDTVRRAYLAPHRGWSERAGILVFPREIALAPDAMLKPFFAALEDRLARLSHVPVTLAWGMKDPVFSPRFIDDMWLASFPHARVIRIEEAGHYLQEDAHEVIVPELVSFVRALECEPSSLRPTIAVPLAPV